MGGWYGPHPKNGKDADCVQCAKSFYIYPSGLLKGKRFCSVRCRADWQRAQRVRDSEARCARCKTWKPFADFVTGRQGVPHSYCKLCSSEWFHEMRGTPSDRRKPYAPVSRLTDEEKRIAKRELNKRHALVRRAAGKAPARGAIDAMWTAQQGRCAYCRVEIAAFHVDHKTPVSRGGTNDIANLHLTCGRCNMRKGAMTHEEFLASKRRPVVQWSAAA